MSLLLLSLLLPLPSAHASLPRCLFVSSYHHGYEWSDGVERGVRKTLNGRCELHQIDMDTKRRKDSTHIQSTVEQILGFMREWQPDVIITADDNAARYLVSEHLKEASTPVVFCGVNWSASEYGFPYPNVTGMIEVAPIQDMLATAQELTGNRAFYIGADTFTERKNLQRVQTAAAALGLNLEHGLAADVAAWRTLYERAQQADFVVMGSYSGILGWEDHAAQTEAHVRASSRRLVVTNHEWMMPYAMLGMTKIPEEQGVWAAQTALTILSGVAPSSIPIIANRNWDLWLNDQLVGAAGIDLPLSVTRRAKRFDPPVAR
ncbi:MAG: hypothetical protein KDK91_02130 [Gammaproteobacteria bacterium]|nr:hypothetical protein [Gammaproteobacteria bacterium]